MRQDDLIRCFYTGQALVPDGNFATAALADRLGQGQVVFVDLDPERSAKSHRHQFAFVRTAWDNLPEAIKDEPFAKTPETLRKHSLISCGFCKTKMVAVGEDGRAKRVARALAGMFEDVGDYAVIQTDGPVVYCFTPESQKLKTMGGARFRESKQAILEWMADLIGVTADQLAIMGRKGAA